jgi:GNAT superfamily N-acetyltransferase
VGPAGVVTVRAAVPADTEGLRELTFASKAHWGYDHDLVRGWADELDFPSGQERWVAEADGAIVAWAGLTPPADDGVAVLDHLWVDPGAMGQGLGSRLFLLAADRARELGAERLEWSAEVNAVGFYEKVGGRKLRDHVTEWGRVAPWMGLDL